MDASGYNMSFDKEQLAILCANYDSRLDSLADENTKLRELCRTLCSLADNGLMELDDNDFTMVMERMRELGVEVDG